MKPYTILRHPGVEFDLYDIADLVAEFAGKSVARNKLAMIERTIAKLVDTPHTGTIRNDIYPGLRAIPAAGKGVVCFTVDDEQRAVYIICIAYAGTEWMKRVAQRG